MKQLLQEEINFALTMLANVDADYISAHNDHDPIQTDLTQKATAALQTAFSDPVFQENCGNWALAWGPAVYVIKKEEADEREKYDKKTAANLVYVAYNSDTNNFFIGVAGTNPFNWYDWLNEDFATMAATPWKNNDANGSLTKGTKTGLDNMTSMTGTVHLKLKDISGIVKIFEYMQVALLLKRDATVTVGGHSLGGALAPALGLSLLEKAPALHKGTWNIRSYAGASPGDKLFKAYFDATLTKKKASFLSTINHYDIVPRAWNNLGGLSSIYADLPKMCICQKPASDKGPYAGMGTINESQIVQGFELWATRLANDNSAISRLGHDTVFNTDASTAGLPLDDCSKNVWGKEDPCAIIDHLAKDIYLTTKDPAYPGYYLKKICDYVKFERAGANKKEYTEEVVRDFLNFMAEAGKQHVVGYMNHFLGAGLEINVRLSELINMNAKDQQDKDAKQKAEKEVFHNFVKNVWEGLQKTTTVTA